MTRISIDSGLESTRPPCLRCRFVFCPTRRKTFGREIFLCSARGQGSRDVTSSQGEVVPSLLRRSGMEVVTSRLEAMGEDDLQQQLWFIRASLTALAIENNTHSPPEASPLPELADDRSPQKSTYERVALAAAQRLFDLALRESGKASWLGLAKTRSRGWWLRPLDADLYAGLPGVTIFLAQAGEVLGEPKFTVLAREALATLSHQLDRRDDVHFVGAYDGWGGLLYTWLYLGLLWQDEELIEKGDHAREKIAEILHKDGDLDLVRGSVGGIQPLLALHEVTGSSEALHLARRLGDRILEKATPFEDGLCWFTESFPVHPLTGLSHGNAGFAWSLLRLSDALGDDKYRDAGRKAINFESRFFSKREQNWMDLRPIQAKLGAADYESECTFSTSWCHGAVGVGLARLESMRFLGADEVMGDLEVAVQTAIRTGFGVSHCLCHGDMGNVELLLRFLEISKDPKLAATAEQVVSRTLDEIAEKGFRSGVPFNVETPGLMEGLAGIGYGFLRLATEGRIPSVLTLQLPPRNRL
ncbi:MAG: type 2 lanthipeptide synthetase LanM [Planctomycetota bacterium]